MTSVAVRPSASTEWVLLDCGEGTQHQILRCDAVRLGRIRKVFITHLHADHVFGLPGLLASQGLHSVSEPVQVFGPEGTEGFLTSVLTMSDTHLPFSIEFRVVKPGLVVQGRSYSVSCALLEHRIPTFGYRIQENDRPGVLDAAAALALGVPSGPMLGRLKRGEKIVLDNGQVVNGAELCGPVHAGASLAFCTDTLPCEAAVDLARGADLLIHEATFCEEDRALAPQHWHSTSVQAAEIARRAGVRRLIITHFSARYSEGGIDRHLAEAHAVFPATGAAEDLMVVEVGR